MGREEAAWARTTDMPKDASEATRSKNAVEAYRNGVVGELSSEHRYAAFGHCSCGCVSDLPKIASSGAEGTVWDQTRFAFLREAYDVNGENLRVHPALWNNGTNNLLSGVFEVLPGRIYQVRGYDMANITFVKTNNAADAVLKADDRWMVMDTLMSMECTEAALVLFESFIREKVDAYELHGKIVGTIISHSHVDHYGGMSAVRAWSAQGGEDPKIPFTMVPEGFAAHAISENVYVGNAMARRASYQYGTFIAPDYSTNAEDSEGSGRDAGDYLSGGISIGIGQGQSMGTVSFCSDNLTEITENTTLVVDELEVEFQLTPGTEAPAEMNNYIRNYRALWLAENCTGTLHNLYTLRGAQVRDGKAWAKFLVEAAVLYADQADVVFQSHNWPHWSEAYAKEHAAEGEVPGLNVRDFLLDTASIYEYINDQTLLYMNMGYKMSEASDLLTIPRRLQKNWCTMPFYGTPKHNAKAVYQRYLGWYDANPLHLEELPPEQLAKEQVRYMLEASGGGSLLRSIEADIQRGNYWIAAYMAHQIVLAESPAEDVADARLLCADALEQLGYQAQSGTWRNAYLCAAFELRRGKRRVGANNSTGAAQGMTTEMILDYIAILFDGERASSKLDFCGELEVKAGREAARFAFVVRNGAIMYYPLEGDAPAFGSARLSVKRETLLRVLAWIQGAGGSGMDAGRFLQEKGAGAELFRQIAIFAVNLTLDRYKHFEIINRHDSDVLIGGSTCDLREVAAECLRFLGEHRDAMEAGAGAIDLSGDEAKAWRSYRDILVAKANVVPGEGLVVEGDAASASAEGSARIEPYEYWLMVCGLRRFFGRAYINNDACFAGGDDQLGTLARLKKQIQLLESYVPDCGVGSEGERGGCNVALDADDRRAWAFLCGEEPPACGFRSVDIYKMLGTCYGRLIEMVGCGPQGR